MLHPDRFHCSAADVAFQRDFEQGRIPPADFSHRQHLRLAYLYLVQHAEVEPAYRALRSTLKAFLQHHGVDANHYHETLTGAWMRAVALMMHRCGSTPSADAFIDAVPVLHDAKVMLTHYTKERLFSDRARRQFVPPDLDPIPVV